MIRDALEQDRSEMPNLPKSDIGREHLRHVRRICISMPEASEKPSHGEPTFFAYSRGVAAGRAENFEGGGRAPGFSPAGRAEVATGATKNIQ